MQPSIALAVRCNWCSKQYPEHRVHRLSNKAQQVICDYCLDWHVKAMDFLGGAPPCGCQNCDRSFADLIAAAPSALDVRIYIVQKDGIYQMLCEVCVQPYVAKRTDLYPVQSCG